VYKFKKIYRNHLIILVVRVVSGSKFHTDGKKRNSISLVTGPRCPEGFRKLRFPDYVSVAQDGGKVVSLTHQPLFTPRK